MEHLRQGPPQVTFQSPVGYQLAIPEGGMGSTFYSEVPAQRASVSLGCSEVTVILVVSLEYYIMVPAFRRHFCQLPM